MIIRLAFSLIAILLAIGLFALTEHANEPSEVTVIASAQSTTSTSWPQMSVPDLGPRFLELVRASKIRPRARTAPRAGYRAAGAVAGHACGGDLPPCYVMLRESGGSPTAYNPTGCNGHGCYGKWQFSGEWRCHFGLSCDIAHWTEAEQDYAARILWDHGRGCRNWSACG